MYHDFYKALVLNPQNHTVSLRWPNVIDWFLRFFCIALFVTVSVLACKEIWRFEDQFLYAVGILFGILGVVWLYVTNRSYVHTKLHAVTASMSPTRWGMLWNVILVLAGTGVAGAIIWAVVEKTELTNKKKIWCMTGVVFVMLIIKILVFPRLSGWVQKK